MLQQQLIAALNNKDFDAVTSIAEQLGQQALQDIQTAPTAEVRAKIHQDATTIIGDALHLARALRSHIAAELHANSASFLYTNSDLEQPHWQIRA